MDDYKHCLFFRKKLLMKSIKRREASDIVCSFFQASATGRMGFSFIGLICKPFQNHLKQGCTLPIPQVLV